MNKGAQTKQNHSHKDW